MILATYKLREPMLYCLLNDVIAYALVGQAIACPGMCVAYATICPLIGESHHTPLNTVTLWDHYGANTGIIYAW